MEETGVRPRSSEQELALVQIFYLFLLPPTLLYFGIIPAVWRFPLLLCIAAIIFGIIVNEKWGIGRLGIRPITWAALRFYLIFTIAGVVLLRLMAIAFEFPPLDAGWWQKTNLLVFFLPVSVLQEFAFRGVLMPLSAKLFNARLYIIVLNVLLFTFIHIIYPPLTVSIPVAIIGGIAFSLAYLKHHNLVLISLAHAALNFVAVGHGFFNI